MNMTKEEAEQWLKGNKTMHNHFEWFDNARDTVLCVEADAHMMEQAYWVLKAHKEKLIGEENDRT